MRHLRQLLERVSLATVEVQSDSRSYGPGPAEMHDRAHGPISEGLLLRVVWEGK